MTRFTSTYVCQQCGYVSPSYLGKCPNCGTWNSFVETVEQVGKTAKGRMAWKSGAVPVRLSEVKVGLTERTSTGNSEIDLVLGGGIVQGMAVLIAGEPGIGKSTLLLAIADSLAKKVTGEILYIAGEESAGQIKIRAARLGIKSEKITVLEETDVEAITTYIEANREKHSLVIVDSIQTITTGDLSGGAGSVGQVRESVGRILATTKGIGVPVFLVGHVTKEGVIAGPKVIEHAVDTILSIEGEKFTTLRLVRSTKNRFGPTDEVGILEMTDSGLKSIANYGELFANRASGTAPGSCLTITMEGTRPILVEIQALVTSTPLPMPRRVATGVNLNRLQMIIAVLQKRLGLPLYKEDIYVSVSGGINISEPAADLPIAVAILSSFRDKAIPKKAIAFGELDLMGNVRQVNSQAKRIKEVKKLGFGAVLSSENLKTIAGLKL